MATPAACSCSASRRWQARRLVDLTYEAMHRAICMVRPGIRLGDLGLCHPEFR